MCVCGCECMHKFIFEPGETPNGENPMTLLCDKNATMQFVEEPRVHSIREK